MPGHSHAALEFFRVLRMDLGALLQRRLDLVLSRKGREILRGEAFATVGKAISPQQYPSSAFLIIRRGVADCGDRLVGIGDAAIDVFVFFPEAALEFQS